mgnify:CR=1 FL=1
MDNNAKLRPLYLAKILYERTDEDHYLTTMQLAQILEEEYGIPVHRQTIKTDIELLQQFGMDIQEVKSTQNRYNLISRQFEIAELKLLIDAIDFNRGTLTIKRTVTEATIDGTMKIIEQDSAKTKSSLRTLPLVGSFRDYFQKVKEAQELNKKVCGNCYNYDYDGYVFVNELGERMRPNYLTEYFPKYIAKHGMPKMRFHDLRHSCASLLLANGVPLKQIQEWLGHSDFSTTANIYAHLDYRSKISSAQAMEQGMLLPRSDDFGSRWEDVTEQGKIAEPDLNPGF